MIPRFLEKKLKSLFRKYPILGIVGPRQSGKTTLAKSLFSTLPYVTLEDLELRSFAKEDPKGFLGQYEKGLIIDEVQYVPELFSYIQVFSDKKDRPGQYVLTGSQHFLLFEKITQSLAGRIALTTLLPLSFGEIKELKRFSKELWSLIFRGFYPRIFKERIEPSDFYPNYIQTYVERDVRQIQNVTDVSQVQRFLKLCAGRIGQLLNLSSLAVDCGISVATAKRWLSLLEMSFVIYILRPHFRNFNKRLVKSPKLYFYDTGLACSLLDIRKEEQIVTHYAKGLLFENFVVSEFLKAFLNRGEIPPLYFWRDKLGHEIDLILEQGQNLIPIEIKSGATVNEDFFKNLIYWKKLSDTDKAYLIYGGTEDQPRKKAHVLSWKNMLNRIDTNF